MEGAKSFYNLDYIIELCEKRVEQYSSGYQLVLGRLTNIILVYSVIGIYLIPIIQDISQIRSSIFDIGAILLLVTLCCSLFYAIRLLIPAEIAYLGMPSVYYQDLRLKYEKKMLKPYMSDRQKEEAEQKINDLIKASYIDELVWAQRNNKDILGRKASLYHTALICGLLAILPYIVCVCYHLSKEDRVQKIEKIVSKSQ